MKRVGGFIFTEDPPEGITPTWEIREGDALDRLGELPDGTVRCWVTSAPYYKKFSYGHPDQCGLEDSVDAYVQYQASVAKEMLRCSTPDANLFYVIQDSFNGSGGVGVDFKTDEGYRVKTVRGALEKGWPKQAQLLIPERIRFAFTAVGWIPLLIIIWDKTDSRRGSVRRPSYSYERILLFGASADHYWNREAVVMPFHGSTLPRVKRGFNFAYADPLNRKHVFLFPELERMQQREGAYLRAVWRINPGNQPKIKVNGDVVKGIASFPLTLAEICVCLGSAPGDLVVDPFSGLNTTGLAAAKWGRNSVSIELSPRFAAAARQRMKDAGF